MNEWFGLGILLECRDTMSAGLQVARDSFAQFTQRVTQDTQTVTQRVDQLNKLSFTGANMIMGGSILSSFGSAMLNPLISMGKQVVSTGSQFEEWRMTLKALYKDQEIATQKANEAMHLAAKTPFEVGDVVQAVIGFKAIGAEALQVMDNIEGVNKQGRTFLEYMGDLAALRPDVGLQGVLLGVRNLIGGDGGKSLRMRMDIDFEQILGEEWADTPDKIMNQLVRVSDKIAGGLMQELEGTWNQIISNLKDQSTRLFLAIGDQGAFDVFKNSLKGIANVINSIDDTKMAKIGKNLAEALSLVWKPMALVLKGVELLIKGIISLASSDSIFAKIALSVLALGGTFFAVTGALLTFGGGILTTVASLGTFLLLMSSAGGFTATFGAMLSVLKTRLLSFGMAMLPLAGAFIAYKTNFLGFGDVVNGFVGSVRTAFSESKRISQLGVTDMMKELGKLDSNNFGDRLTYRLTQVRVFWEALVDAWNDNELSDENFRKVNELGLLPLLTTILNVKARFEAFWKGFKEGWSNVAKVVSGIVSTISRVVMEVIGWFFPLNEEVSNVSEAIGGIDTSKWEKFGEITAYIVSFLGGLWAITKVFAVISTVGVVIGKVVAFLGSAITMIGSFVTAVLWAIGIVVTLPEWAVGAIVVAIGAVIALIVHFWDDIKAGFMKFKAWLGEWWAGVKEYWSQKLNELKESWNGFCESLKTKYNNFKQWVVDGFNNIKDKVVSFCDSVKQFFSNLWDTIVNTFNNVINNISAGWEWIKTKFFEGCEAVKQFFSNLWNNILAGFSAVGSWLSGIWTGICQFFSNGINAIGQWFSTLWSNIAQWFSNTAQWWSNVWSGFSSFISGGLNTLSQWFSNIWNSIAEWFSNTGKRWSETWSAFTTMLSGGLESVRSWFSEKFQAISDFVSGVFEGIGGFATTCKETITTIWSGMTGFFSGIFNGIKEASRSMFAWFEEKFGWIATMIDKTKDFIGSVGSGIKNTTIKVVNGAKKMVGLNTGGYVKTEGVAMLHPNEVVVNDDLTQKLRTFLDEPLGNINLEKNITTGDTLPSVNNNFERNAKMESPSVPLTRAMMDTSNQTMAKPNSTNTPSNTDNSVTINEGAIQINIAKATDEEANKLAKTIMEKIKREMQLRNTLNYRPV